MKHIQFVAYDFSDLFIYSIYLRHKFKIVNHPNGLLIFLPFDMSPQNTYQILR